MARGRTTGTTPAGPRAARRWPLARGASVAVVVALSGLAAWQGTLTHRSPDAHWSVLAIIAVAVAAALVVGHGRQRTTSRGWLAGTGRALAGWRQRSPAQIAGVVGWLALAGAAIGWDLDSFVHQSHDLPTLSHFVGRVTAVPAGRGLLFAAWLALGVYLVVGWRRRDR